MAAIQPKDVLFGRGGATNQHVGNQVFRDLVAEQMPAYLSARKKDKVEISYRIVAAIKHDGGRFLKCCPDGISWVEVSDKRAREKTSQALREGLDVRHRTFRTDKRPRQDSKSNENNPRTRPRVVTGVVIDSASLVSTQPSNARNNSFSSDDGEPDLLEEEGFATNAIEETTSQTDHLERLMIHFEPPRTSVVHCDDVVRI